MKKKFNPARKVVTGEDTLFSYLHVIEREMNNGVPGKYSASLLIPKTDTVTLAKVQAGIKAAMEDGRDILGPDPEKINNPLHDGDKKNPPDPDYKGYWYLSAKSDDKPRVVDRHVKDIKDPNEIYSGMFGRASVTFYPYSKNGNRGVGCGLNSLQKLKDGRPLGVYSRPEEDYPDEEDDDDFLL